MKKRLVLLMVLGVMSAGLQACGNEAVNENEPSETDLEANEADTSESTAAGSEEATDEDVTEDVTIEVVEAGAHSEEYNERYELGERTGSTYKKAGDSEVTEFSDWKEGYSTLIEEMASYGVETGYQLIYVDENEIPELAYYNGYGKLVMAAFSGGYVTLFSSQLDTIYFDEKNNVCLASEAVETDFNDYVVALKDGYWIEIACGIQAPRDIWAEDSFDENGNPIISYWEINGKELSSQEKYDELLAKYYDINVQGSEVKPSESADTILAEIDAM